MLRIITSTCVFLVLIGCSSIPDVEYSYYFAKSEPVLTAAQAVSCDDTKTKLIVVTMASPVAMNYAADIERKRQTISIRDIEGPFHTFADSDATFGFYDDGRLKSINQNTTGQGEAVIKSAVSLATTAIPLFAAKTISETKPNAAPESEACKIVDKWAGTTDGKLGTVNLSYSAKFNIVELFGQSFPIQRTDASSILYEELNKQLQEDGAKTLPVVEAKIGRPSVGERATAYAAEDYDVPLYLQNTAKVEVSVLSDHHVISKALVTVPMPGTYALPIPRAALFGKQNFGITLSEAGAIQSVDYGKLSGAAGALNAAGAVANAGPQIVANEAADIKAKADLIAQTQRLLQCHTNPSACK
jgi:hypothetical protein